MNDVDYMSIAEDSITKIKKGAFLTVKSESALNTMAIGWASFGVVWGKPIMMVRAVEPAHLWYHRGGQGFYRDSPGGRHG